MDGAYDYFYTDDDPDELFQETIGLQDEVERMLKELNPEPGLAEAIDEYYITSLSKLIFGSNLIEIVGASSVDITYKLCREIFLGNDVELSDEAIMWDADRCEIIQHARALMHMVTEMVIHDKALSEELILETHRILCHKVSDPSCGSFEMYAGRYRTESVVCTFTSFAPVGRIPRLMANLVDESNADISRAVQERAIDPYVLASKMCHKFVNIHPFIDGNGRICRLILNAILPKYTGVLVCLGEKESDWEEYLTIASRSSALEADCETQEVDDESKPAC